MTWMSRWLPPFILPVVMALLVARTGVDAGVVTRPTKTCGTTSYAAEVAAGCLTIKSSEVDADLNAILTGGVNNIETANVNAAGLGTTAIANLAVTTAKINDLAVTTGKIAALAVTTAEIGAAAVTAAKLADGATAVQIINASASSITPIGTNTTILSQAITMTRTRVRIIVSWNGHLDSGASLNDPITVELLRDGGVIATVTSRIAVTAIGFDIPVAGTIPYVDTTTAAAHTYLLRMTITGGSQTTTINAQMLLEEVA